MPAPRHRTRLLPCAVAALLTLAGCGGAPSAAPAAPVLAPPGPAAVAPPPAEMTARPRVVVLDPGHNGGNAAAPAAISRLVPDGRGGRKACNTTGTSTDAGYAEHAFALDVAQRVAQRLATRGVRVVLTRDTDTGVGPCVDERGHAGERADADAVVSIHADGAAPDGRGFHVAYSDPPLNDAQRGPARVLADELRDGLARAGFLPSTYVGRDGLSPRYDLAGLNHATRPTALVECANMRNAQEAAVVSSATGRDRYAAAIADGVLQFLNG